MKWNRPIPSTLHGFEVNNPPKCYRLLYHIQVYKFSPNILQQLNIASTFYYEIDSNLAMKLNRMKEEMSTKRGWRQNLKPKRTQENRFFEDCYKAIAISEYTVIKYTELKSIDTFGKNEWGTTCIYEQSIHWLFITTNSLSYLKHLLNSKQKTSNSGSTIYFTSKWPK